MATAVLPLCDWPRPTSACFLLRPVQIPPTPPHPPHLPPSSQVGYNYFRLHPKGVGLVCKRSGGLPPLTFVEEYLGEIHTPWRWFEIQVGGRVLRE